MRTTHDAPPESHAVEVAPSWRRTCAAAVDGLPLLAGAIALGWHLAPTLGVRWNPWDHAVDLFWADPRAFWIPVVALAGASVLLPLVWALLKWRSPGQRLLKLRTIDARRGRPSLVRTFFHALARAVSFALMGVGPLWALVDPERRTLYDRLARVYAAVEPASSVTSPGEVERREDALL